MYIKFNHAYSLYYVLIIHTTYYITDMELRLTDKIDIFWYEAKFREVIFIDGRKRVLSILEAIRLLDSRIEKPYVK